MVKASQVPIPTLEAADDKKAKRGCDGVIFLKTKCSLFIVSLYTRQHFFTLFCWILLNSGISMETAARGARDFSGVVSIPPKYK